MQFVLYQLLVDDFARNGLQTYLPDIFNGDALPADIMSNPPPGGVSNISQCALE